MNLLAFSAGPSRPARTARSSPPPPQPQQPQQQQPLPPPKHCQMQQPHRLSFIGVKERSYGVYIAEIRVTGVEERR